ncbi:ATP-binding protein [Streptomyces sp. NPDC052693]|uniref:sensor histidine kinase n=1 Tax=Streptomyces sp. NPDC052693 TaxID=3155814 RepID=UPI00343ACF4E
MAGLVNAGDDPAEHRRLAVLERYGIIGAPAPPDLDAIVRLTARVCEAPQAAVNIISADRQHQIAAVGIAPTVCSRSDSMCAVSIAAPGQVLVPDARQDPRFAANPWVTAPTGAVRFYAASQLHSPEGETLGTLCVFAQEVRSLSERQRQALDDLASLVVDVLDLHRHRQLLHHALLAADQARAELERSNMALEQFAGQVSHDLKNPLTGITGHAGLLAELPGVSGNTQAAAFVGRIEAATSRMNRTIEAALSQARTGGQLHLTDTDLQVLTQEAVEDLREELTRTQAHVCLGTLPVICCDGTQIRRLLQNLIANAAKFRRPGRPARIEVSCVNDADGWNISVTDNGVGIPPEQRRHVLEPFARLDTGAPGSGIGLATCLRIAVAHRGTLTVDAADGGGTTVTCHLPYPSGMRD